MTPNSTAIRSAAAAKFAAPSGSFSPSFWPVSTWPPILGIVTSPDPSHMYIPAAPTAATAPDPSRPTQNMSTRL